MQYVTEHPEEVSKVKGLQRQVKEVQTIMENNIQIVRPCHCLLLWQLRSAGRLKGQAGPSRLARGRHLQLSPAQLQASDDCATSSSRSSTLRPVSGS